MITVPSTPTTTWLTKKQNDSKAIHDGSIVYVNENVGNSMRSWSNIKYK